MVGTVHSAMEDIVHSVKTGTPAGKGTETVARSHFYSHLEEASGTPRTEGLVVRLCPSTEGQKDTVEDSSLPLGTVADFRLSPLTKEGMVRDSRPCRVVTEEMVSDFHPCQASKQGTVSGSHPSQ